MRWPSGTILQEWEGVVIEIYDKSFLVSLLDITADSTYANEETEIQISELRPSEIPFLRIGAIFLWRIYERDGNTVSYFRFSRRKWTQRMIDHAEKKAQKLSAGIIWQ